jgi:MFS family permease
VSLAAGISGALASWVSWRAAFMAPALVSIATGIVYLWLTPDDRHHAGKRKTVAAVPLTPQMAVAFFGLIIVIAVSAGITFNVLTIALPKIVDERLAKDVPLVLVGSIATAVLICGALAQLSVGRLVERIPAHVLFAIITGLGALGNLWAATATGEWSLVAALAIAVAAIYGQVTVNDIVIARYTADAWRGRIYAVRYFLLFISAGIAIGMISLLHNSGGFGLVLAINAVITLVMFVTTVALTWLVSTIEGRHVATAPAE